MSSLLSIDPGKTTGWARFCKEGSTGFLLEAGVYKHSSGPLNPPKEWHRKFDRVLIELPQQRLREKRRIRVEDLIKLAVLVGEYKQFFENLGAEVKLVWPTTWKGSVPKKLHNEWVIDKLGPEELALLPKRPIAKDYDNNMVDAIGMGLWDFGRML